MARKFRDCRSMSVSAPGRIQEKGLCVKLGGSILMISYVCPSEFHITH